MENSMDLHKYYIAIEYVLKLGKLRDQIEHEYLKSVSPDSDKVVR